MAKKTKEALAAEETVQEAETVNAKTVPDTVMDAPDPNELVPFYLFRDNDKYKDDVFVAVNGESCLIQRGQHVMIKRKFAEVLLNSQDQDNKTAGLIRQHAEEFSGMDALK